MFTAVRKYKVDPDKVDELARRVHAEFVDLISRAPGFIHYYLVHGGNGVVVTVSVFETQAGAEESTKLAAEWVGKNLATLVQGPPDVTAGETLVHR